VQKKRKERKMCGKKKVNKNEKISLTLMVAKVKILNLDLMSKDLEVKFGKII